MRFFVLTLLVAVWATVLSSRVEADPHFELNLFIKSQHYYEPSNRKEFNETHNGVGFTMHEGGDSPYSHTIMYYKNSLERDSLSYMLNRRFWCEGVVCVGGAIVAATSYSKHNPAGIAAAPFLTISIGPVRSIHLPGVVSGYGLGIPLGEYR